MSVVRAVENPNCEMLQSSISSAVRVLDKQKWLDSLHERVEVRNAGVRDGLSDGENNASPILGILDCLNDLRPLDLSSCVLTCLVCDSARMCDLLLSGVEEPGCSKFDPLSFHAIERQPP